MRVSSIIELDIRETTTWGSSAAWEPAPHEDVFPCKWAILQFCGRGLWDLNVKSSDIAIPIQPLKVGKEGSDLYLLSLARLD